MPQARRHAGGKPTGSNGKERHRQPLPLPAPQSGDPGTSRGRECVSPHRLAPTPPVVAGEFLAADLTNPTCRHAGLVLEILQLSNGGIDRSGAKKGKSVLERELDQLRGKCSRGRVRSTPDRRPIHPPAFSTPSSIPRPLAHQLTSAAEASEAVPPTAGATAATNSPRVGRAPPEAGTEVSDPTGRHTALATLPSHTLARPRRFTQARSPLAVGPATGGGGGGGGGGGSDVRGEFRA